MKNWERAPAKREGRVLNEIGGGDRYQRTDKKGGRTVNLNKDRTKKKKAQVRKKRKGK